MRAKTSLGFTLIELLTVVAIVGILGGAAIPSMTDIFDANQSTTNLNDFVHRLHLTRNHALQSGKYITICAKGENQVCGRDWSAGQLIFEDKNENLQVDIDEWMIYTGQSLTKEYRLTWRAFQNKRYLRYSPTGMTDWQNGTFRFCNLEKPKLNRALIINAPGRVRLSKDSNGDGYHEDRTGNKIICD